MIKEIIRKNRDDGDENNQIFNHYVCTYRAKNCAETAHLGSCVAASLKNISPPFLILLQGPLGSGKTTFIKNCIANLASMNTESISSPTFQYVSLYTTQKDQPIAHFDLWRMNDPALFHSLGFDEIADTSYSFIEWPERLPKVYREQITLEDCLSIVIHVQHENERMFELSFTEKYRSIFKDLI